MQIKFYHEYEEYGYLSNFYEAPIIIEGIGWSTNEHYYQAGKFLDPLIRDAVRTTPLPILAKNIGNNRSNPLREDWDEIKDRVMYECCYAKFTQHSKLKKKLLSTGNAILIEDSANDGYWGIGKGDGKNKLGIILMKIRTILGEV